MKEYLKFNTTDSKTLIVKIVGIIESVMSGEPVMSVIAIWIEENSNI